GKAAEQAGNGAETGMGQAAEQAGNAAGMEEGGEEPAAKKPSTARRRVLIYARTYAIAAEIYLEQRGRRDEYPEIANDTGELKKFVQQQFGVANLAGTFKKLKGYSFWKVLEGHDD